MSCILLTELGDLGLETLNVLLLALPVGAGENSSAAEGR